MEEVIYTHPDIEEAAVFGVPHDRWIEAVTAAIVLKKGRTVTEQEMIEYCRNRLAGFKTPKYVRICSTLPKNASGKILKRELRVKYNDIGRGVR